MASNSSDYTLSFLLSTTPYTFAYALPLLLLSTLLTFAGTFLTLDRTRAFAPRDDVLLAPSPKDTTLKRFNLRLRDVFLLEGGIGGLSVGYSFGVHLATFLALAIPNTTTSSRLGSAAFIAVWAVSAIICTTLGGRWRYAAFTMAGIAGYATLGLAVCVIVHPTLITRVVIITVFVPLGSIASLLPLQRYQHAFLRLAISSMGAFGLTLAIALFAQVPSWSNVWERLWVSNGTDGWSSAQERGLSAGYCLFLILGAACDWFLHRRFGENPDQKWDAYLAHYATALPNEPGRAGTFAPIKSFWSRHFGYKGMDPIAQEIIYPTDADLKHPPPSPKVLKKQASLFAPNSPTKVFEPPKRQEFLRKPKKDTFVPGFKRTRPAIKFSPLDVDDLSSSDEEDDPKGAPVQIRVHELSSSRSNSVSTLVNQSQKGSRGVEDLDMAKELERIRAAVEGTPDNETPDYSDYEEDVTVSAGRNHTSRDAPGWTPPFLLRHSSSIPPHPSLTSGRSNASRPTLPSAQSTPTTLSPPLAPVLATPSLIRAIDRVSRAQQEAYAVPECAGLPPSSDEMEVRRHAGGWQSFWRDVKVRAAHGHDTHPA